MSVHHLDMLVLLWLTLLGAPIGVGLAYLHIWLERKWTS